MEVAGNPFLVVFLKETEAEEDLQQSQMKMNWRKKATKAKRLRNK